MPFTIGILGLQGGFSVHQATLNKLHIKHRIILQPQELQTVEGLIIPGGESSTLLKLMQPLDFISALQAFHAQGKGLFGTCAGTIFLAKQVKQPQQVALGVIDIIVTRNAYGRQLDSFIEQGQLNLPNSTPKTIKMLFIRAPKISQYGSTVTILATCKNAPVLVQQANVLAATFHPELSSCTIIHQYFIEQVCQAN